MPRKKVEKIEEEQTTKKTRHYTKHLPEQRVFASYITEQMIPYMAEHWQSILPDLEEFVNNKTYLSKEKWSECKQIVLDLCAFNDQENMAFSTFKIERIQAAKYHATHSGYYNVNGGDHAKYFVKKINEAYSFDVNDPKQKKFYDGAMYTACCHLAYYVTAPEKL